VTLEKSIEPLVALGFSGLESEIYSLLLRESAVTGYRIAQALRKPASNVYKAIESLEAKGSVMVDHGRHRMCRAVPLDEVLARLEHRFREARSRAVETLAAPDGAEADQRVYTLRSPEAVQERARAMLRRASEVAILDAFPARSTTLEDDLAAAAGRGVLVALNAYAPTAIEGVDVVRSVHSDRTRGRWPGDWLNLVVDGREFLIAFLTHDGTSVHQAIWSGSPYLAWAYHSALSSELILNVLEDLIERGAAAERLRSELTRLQRLKALGAPGYHELVNEIAEQEEPETRKR
jgi:sugar-specific transcriptional regulator TrmB